jgi:sugar (pentulose or hexulose) kinase
LTRAGNPLANILIHADTRAVSECAYIADVIGRDAIYASDG